MTVMEDQQQEEEDNKEQWKRFQRNKTSSSSSPINNLDDGCLMHIFSFLPPIPGITLSPPPLLSSIFAQNSYLFFQFNNTQIFVLSNFVILMDCFGIYGWLTCL